MSLPEGNPRIPEGINSSDEHPLKEFLQLAFAVISMLVIAVLLLSLLTRFLAPYVPFEWELAVSPTIQSYLTGEGESTVSPRQRALSALAGSILNSSLKVPVNDHTSGDHIPAQYFTFTLMEMPTPNAFATLGGNIAVTDSLLEKVTSENGLAMVVAHEIAHVQLRHPIEAASRGVIVQLALSAVLGSTGNNLLSGTLSTGGALTLLNFNRNMELAADERALAIIREHYGHTLGADEFFTSMDSDEASVWLEFTQTHPSTDKRLALIQSAMTVNPADARLTQLPEALRTRK